MSPSPPDHGHFDAVLPPEMAARAEDVGVRKARLDAVSLFALAVLAGAFISLGAIFATTVPVTIGNIIGGAVMVGIVYWFIYLRGPRPTGSALPEGPDSAS